MPMMSLTFWVPTLLPRGGGKQELLIHWGLCNTAGNTSCPGITASAMASTEQKNFEMQSWGAWAQSQALYYMKKGKNPNRRQRSCPKPSPKPSILSPRGAAAFQPSPPLGPTTPPALARAQAPGLPQTHLHTPVHDTETGQWGQPVA